LSCGKAHQECEIVTSGKEDEEFFRQRGFGIRIGFGERPALIVIDMVKGFTDPAMPLGADLDGQIAAQPGLWATGQIACRGREE
jgi:maleamate amidohydrolase